MTDAGPVQTRFDLINFFAMFGMYDKVAELQFQLDGSACSAQRTTLHFKDSLRRVPVTRQRQRPVARLVAQVYSLHPEVGAGTQESNGIREIL